MAVALRFGRAEPGTQSEKDKNCVMGFVSDIREKYCPSCSERHGTIGPGPIEQTRK